LVTGGRGECIDAAWGEKEVTDGGAEWHYGKAGAAWVVLGLPGGLVDGLLSLSGSVGDAGRSSAGAVTASFSSLATFLSR